MLGTIRAVERRLMQGGLVMRHDPAEIETGLAHGEGAFLACSFWLVDAMVMTGRKEEGQRLFDRLLKLRNDVGCCRRSMTSTRGGWWVSDVLWPRCCDVTE